MEGDHSDKKETLLERASREEAEKDKSRKREAARKKEQLANLEFNRVLDANTMNLDIEAGHDCLRHPKPYQGFPTGVLKVVSYRTDYRDNDIDGFAIFDTDGADFEMTIQSISKDIRVSYRRDAFFEEHSPTYKFHSFEVGIVTHHGFGNAYMLRSEGVTVDPLRKRIITRLDALKAEEELYLRFCTVPSPSLFASFGGGRLVRLPFSPAIVAADYRPVLRVTKPGTALKVQVCSLESSVPPTRERLRRTFQAASVSDDVDCAVICRGRIFLCQRAILSKESPVLRATIEAWHLTVLSETFQCFLDDKAIIRMEDGTPEIVEALLRYVHAGDFDISVDLMALLLLARNYQMPGLVEQCGKGLLEKVTTANSQSFKDVLFPFEKDWQLLPWWNHLRNKIHSSLALMSVALGQNEQVEAIHNIAIASSVVVQTHRDRIMDLPPLSFWDIVSCTDHRTAAQASTTCKVFRGIVGNASRMLFAQVPEKSCSTSNLYQNLLDTRTDVLNWLWEVHSHPQMLGAPRVFIHRVAELIDVYFAHRRVREVSVEQVACAAMAEALSQWFAPAGACDFTVRLLTSIGCVAVDGGYGEGGDYWTCFMVGMSEGRCTVAEVQMLRAFLKSEYPLWFCKATALCGVRRIACATGMSEKARVCASLLCDLTLTLRCNEEWRWGRDVRVAACALVSFLVVDCCYWDIRLRPEDLKKAVDILRMAGWPKGITTCTEQLIEMIRGYEISGRSVAGVITRDAEEKYKNWKVDYKLWKQDDDLWDGVGRVSQVRGLIASLQQVIRRPGPFRFQDLNTLEQHADVWSSYFHNQHFDWDAFFLGMKLRGVWMHHSIHRVFRRHRRK